MMKLGPSEAIVLEVLIEARAWLSPTMIVEGSDRLLKKQAIYMHLQRLKSKGLLDTRKVGDATVYAANSISEKTFALWKEAEELEAQILIDDDGDVIY